MQWIPAAISVPIQRRSMLVQLSPAALDHVTLTPSAIPVLTNCLKR